MLFAAIAAAPAVGVANGRRPTAVNVYFDPSEPDRLFAGVTFGMLISTDGGQTWRWVCEDAACPGPQEGFNGCDTFDPDVEILDNGDFFLTTIFGVHASTDGVTYAVVDGPLATRFVGDIELASNGTLWAITSDGALENDVWASTDGGDTWASRGRPLQPGWWDTIQTAPSNPQRVYLSGFVPGQPDGDGGFSENQHLLFSSENGGTSWTQLETDNLPAGAKINLELVSPVDPDLVFVRVRDFEQDILYRSSNAGQSFTEVLRLDNTSDNPSDPAASMSLAVRKDGTTYLAGSPKGGLHISADSGATWSAAPVSPMVWCLNVDDDDLIWACSENWDPDNVLDPSVRAAVVTSSDAQTWSQVFRFSDIAGAFEAPAGTPQHDVCDEQRWCSMAEMFGIDDSACGASTIDAGPNAADGGPGAKNGNGSCGCSVAFASALFALPPWTRRRRRRRSLRVGAA